MPHSSFDPHAPKPTILQVIPSLGTGGAEIEAEIIASAVVKAGGRALVACATPDKARQNPDVEYRNLPLQTKNPLQMIKNIFLLKTLISQEKVDIVHARSRGPAWSAYWASRLLRVPFVTTYHAAYKAKSRSKTLYNSVMAKGERVIAISHFIKNHIRKNYKECSWFKEEALCLIERGVDLSLFDPALISEDRIEQMRHLWKCVQGKRLLIVPGRITRNKGHETAIEALALLKDKTIDLILVGSDHNHEPYRKFLLQYADSLGLKDRVYWKPPAPDLPAAYQLADIVLCPSRIPEGFGRVVAEAQAMKKPIIVSAHGAAPEVIKEGLTGWSFPPENAQALAQVLEGALALPPEKLAEMGEKGRERVKEKYDQCLMETKTIEVYRELL